MRNIPHHTPSSPTNQNPFPIAFGRSTGNSDYSYYKSEPAPMGISDFGFGPNGSRDSYTSSSFLGIAELTSLSTKNSTGDATMSFQLNVNLQIMNGSNQNGHFWIQNTVVLNTSSNSIQRIQNDVFNQSLPNANMSDAGISGNGNVHNEPPGGADYRFVADTFPFGPPVTANYSLPFTIKLEVNASSNSGGTPYVSFSYDYGRGWQLYDNLSFTRFFNISPPDVSFVVAPKYNPDGSFENAEFIAGGAANGWNTTDLASDARLQLQFWNGHNYQQVYNAYNYGGDTAEGISNVVSSSFASSNGSLASQLAAGSGTLRKLYDASKVSIISIQVPFGSGTLNIANSSSVFPKNATGYAFVGGLVNVTLSPGTYTFYLYSQDGLLQKNLSESLTAGENKAVNITSISSSSSSTLPINFSSTGSLTLTTSFSSSSSLTSTQSSSETTIPSTTSVQFSTSSTTHLLSSAPSASYDSQSIILLVATVTIILVLALATFVAVRRRKKIS